MRAEGKDIPVFDRMLRSAGRALAACALLMLSVACQTGPDEELSSIDAPAAGQGAGEMVGNNVNLERDYELGHNDLISVRVFGQDSLSGEHRINADGSISMPLLGDVPASGRTAGELTREITDRLRDGYLRDPQVSVQVVEYRPVFVVGAVKSPGSYEYMTGMTVLQAVAMAGGYSEEADTTKPVVVTRGSTSDVRRGHGTPSTRVFPGDTIEVPERYAFIH